MTHADEAGNGKLPDNRCSKEGKAYREEVER